MSKVNKMVRLFAEEDPKKRKKIVKHLKKKDLKDFLLLSSNYISKQSNVNLKDFYVPKDDTETEDDADMTP